MAKQPAFQFYPGDWIQDTRMLTPATRGVWIDMLCFMWRSDSRGKISGTVPQLARLLSCSDDEIKTSLNELLDTKCANVTFGNAECNAVVTVENRRMTREEKERESTRCRVKRFRNAETKRECNDERNENVTTHSSSSSSSSINNPPKSPLKISAGKPPEINFNFETRTWENITPSDTDAWSKAYPACDVSVELLGAREWLLSHPEKRKMKYRRFITGWLSRSQQRGGTPKQGGNGNGNGSVNARYTTGPYRRDPGAGRTTELPPDVQRTIDEVNRRAREQAAATPPFGADN